MPSMCTLVNSLDQVQPSGAANTYWLIRANYMLQNFLARLRVDYAGPIEKRRYELGTFITPQFITISEGKGHANIYKGNETVQNYTDIQNFFNLKLY